MAFGIQVKLKNGQDLVTLITPMFYLDYITSGSGSKSYQVPYNKLLKVMTTVEFNNGTPTASKASVSGNTVNYSDATGQRPVIVYAE